MKLVCLNTWGGLAGHKPLHSFFEQNKTVDIFCLQEMWEGGRYLIGTTLQGGPRELSKVDESILFEGVSYIASALPDHAVYFNSFFRGHYGTVFFIKKSIAVLEEGSEYIYREEGYINPENIADHARTIHYVRIQTDDGVRTIAQLHGLWNGQGKGDSDDRLLQSEKVIAALTRFKEPIVLCGDFNLLPDTQSIRIIENAGFENLITKYGITSTRSSHYPKPIKYADYIFVNQGVTVNDFKVLPDEVSDHLPLYLDFA